MSNQPETHDMIVSRTIQAPRERVWRAWTDPDEVMTWWGPQGFTSPMCRMDFREGGTTLVSMRSEQGWEVVNSWTYTSIEPMHRIEFVNRFVDAGGNRISPAELGLPPTIPDEVRHVLTFTAIYDTTTKLTVHEFGYPDEQIVEVSRAGMEQVLDKLAAAVEGGERWPPS